MASNAAPAPAAAKKDAAPPPPPPPTYSVQLVDTGDAKKNTIVLGGVEIVVPIEMDAGGHPTQDDAVRLASHAGTYDKTLTARNDRKNVIGDTKKQAYYYHFTDVPPGLYDVSVCIGKAWAPLSRGIVVAGKQKGVRDAQDNVLADKAPVQPPPAKQGGGAKK